MAGRALPALPSLLAFLSGSGVHHVTCGSFRKVQERSLGAACEVLGTFLYRTRCPSHSCTEDVARDMPGGGQGVSILLPSWSITDGVACFRELESLLVFISLTHADGHTSHARLCALPRQAHGGHGSPGKPFWEQQASLVRKVRQVSQWRHGSEP